MYLAVLGASINCMEFSYKMLAGGSWIYAGGAPSSAFNPDVVSPFQTWGAVFTNVSEAGQWHTGKVFLSIRPWFFYLATLRPGQI